MISRLTVLRLTINSWVITIFLVSFSLVLDEHDISGVIFCQV
jgi:hypothetical protein